MKSISVCLLALTLLLMLSFTGNLVPRMKARVSFVKPSQSSLWITTSSISRADKQSVMAIDGNHRTDFMFGGGAGRIIGFTQNYVASVNFPPYSQEVLSGKRASGAFGGQWWGRLFVAHSVFGRYNATSTFAGMNTTGNGYNEGTIKNYVFVPYNLTGFLGDFEFSNIDSSLGNATYYLGAEFEFADHKLVWEIGNTRAQWNSTMNAIVVSSTTKPGYVAFAVRKQPDTTGPWTFSYSIWNSSQTFSNWVSNRWVLDNSTNGAIPTTTTAVYGALAYNIPFPASNYKLHFSAYIAFGLTMTELNTNLNSLNALDVVGSYDDTNNYWYNLYTQNSAVNFGNSYLNQLYYWAKHLVNVGHKNKRYLSAGWAYRTGFEVYMQDGAYAVYSSMATGQWENAKRYLDNVLANGIEDRNWTRYFDTPLTNYPYSTIGLIRWSFLPYQESNGHLGQIRTTLDYLDSVINYISYSGNMAFAQANWNILTGLVERVHALTAYGTLPLNQPSEDGDSSLQCNIIHYHVLKEFAKLSSQIGSATYASTLNTRASSLKTQLNKNVGSGGLWSPTANYFVNSSSVSPSDSNPVLWLWHNALAIVYDVANSEPRKSQILSAIASKLEVDYGFIDEQYPHENGNYRIWYMKLYDLARAYASIEDSSKISRILWSHVTNPYSGLPTIVAGTSWRPSFSFPENWIESGDYNDGGAWQYAWSSSPATMTIEVLLGIQPSINNVKVQPSKPSNVTTITAINVKVRNALCNISISGDGDYVNSILVDGSTIFSQVIPSIYYNANHEVIVTLGNKPTSPTIKDSTSEITDLSYSVDRLTFMISASSGTTGITKVYAGDKGKPTNVSGTRSWSYDENTKIVTAVHESPAEVEIRWSPGGGMEVNGYLLLALGLVTAIVLVALRVRKSHRRSS